MEKRGFRLGIEDMLLNIKRIDSIARYMIKSCPGISSVIVKKNSIVVTVFPERIYDFFCFIKSHANVKLNYLLDIWCVDYPTKKDRFEVNYLLGNLQYNYRVIIKTSVKEFGGLSSITSLFSSAGWLEREVWDMFGVSFYSNADLRRILTDYGFEGHPLRKDFPLSGFYEVRYDDEVKRVVYEPIEIGQEYRNFKFNSPWELP